MNKEKERKSKDLNLTTQQNFNFNSNGSDKEDTKVCRKIQSNKKLLKLNKKMKEIIKIKNKYKRKYNITLNLLILVVVLFIGSLVVFIPTTMQNSKKHLQKKEELVLDENIVFLGDSITELYDVNKYYKNYHVVNSGQGGNTTIDILNNLDSRVYQYNPSKVFLLIGTNDMFYKYPKDEIYKNIVKIVDKIEKNRSCTKIYVQSIYPINNSDDSKISKKSVKYRTNEVVNYINKKLKEKYKNSDVTFIDVNKKLLDDNGLLDINYTIDGVHISEDGYKKITSILLSYVGE